MVCYGISGVVNSENCKCVQFFNFEFALEENNFQASKYSVCTRKRNYLQLVIQYSLFNEGDVITQ